MTMLTTQKRILDLNFKKKTLSVKTFSPYTNEYKLEKEQNFDFNKVNFSSTTWIVYFYASKTFVCNRIKDLEL